MMNQLSQHRIKLVSMAGLIIIGIALGYHKKQNFSVIPQQLPIIHVTTPAPQLITPISPTLPLSASVTPKAIILMQPVVVAKKSPIIIKQFYILQLLASHHHTALQQFAHKNHLEKNTTIIIMTYQNRPWYVLAYGKFDHVSEANRVRTQLSQKLPSLHPWIRSIRQ